MRLVLVLIPIFYSVSLYGENNPVVRDDSTNVSKEQMVQALDMLKDLGTKGIDIYKDSLLVSDEFKRLLNDEAYTKSIYPDTYTWEQTINYIKAKELKKAFWYLINLYPTSDKNKELVIQSVISYEALVKMDNILINTFYTYAFTDPESSIIVDNSPEIINPDVFEGKLRTVKELILYIHKYRELKAQQLNTEEEIHQK